MRIVASLFFYLILIQGTTLAQTDPIQIKKDSNSVYIGSYYIYGLGSISKKYQHTHIAYDHKRIPRRLANNAEVLSKGGFDIISLQGVKTGKAGEWALKDLCFYMNFVYKTKYKYIKSGSIGKGVVHEECMAFLYDSTRVKELKGRKIIPTEKGHKLIKTYWESGSIDFALIGVSLSWGYADARKSEVLKIKDILENTAAYSKDPDVMIVGNFNRFAKNQSAIKMLNPESQHFFCPHVQSWDEGFSTEKYITRASIKNKDIPYDNPDFLSTTCSVRREVHDLILCSEDLLEEFGATMSDSKYNEHYGVIVYDEVKGTGFINGTQRYASGIREAYSDHRPIWIKLNTDTGTMDHPTK